MEHCFRCGEQLAKLPDSTDTVEFYRCDHCLRDYSKTRGKSLVDRWPNPVPLALYELIYDNDFEEAATELVDDLFLVNARSHIQRMLTDLEEELQHPKQKLIHALNFQILWTEEQLRLYLEIVVEKLRERLEKS